MENRSCAWRAGKSVDVLVLFLEHAEMSSLSFIFLQLSLTTNFWSTKQKFTSDKMTE